MRIAVIGNAGGGKPTLASKLAIRQDLPVFESDPLLVKNMKMVSEEEYLAAHEQVISNDRWIFEGLGLATSFPARIDRATHVVFIDLPAWQHYWMAAERQRAWERGDEVYNGSDDGALPSLKELFKMIDYVDQNYLPSLRVLVSEAERAGSITLHTIKDFEQLDEFAGFDA